MRGGVTTIPLDQLPGRRCFRACEMLRRIRQEPSDSGFLKVPQQQVHDELVFADLQRSGVVRVHFLNDGVLIDTRGEI